MHMANEVKKYGKSKTQLVKAKIKTHNYQRVLIREHIICMQNGADAKVLFDADKNKYYVLCSDCKKYKKRSKK